MAFYDRKLGTNAVGFEAVTPQICNPCGEVRFDAPNWTNATITLSDDRAGGMYNNSPEIVKEQLEKLIEEKHYEEADKDHVFAYINTDVKSNFYVPCLGNKEIKVGTTLMTSQRIAVKSYEDCLIDAQRTGCTRMCFYPLLVKDVYKDPAFKIFKVKIEKSKISQILGRIMHLYDFEVVEEVKLLSDFGFKVVNVAEDRMTKEYIVNVEISNKLTKLAAVIYVHFDNLDFTQDALMGAVDKKVTEALRMCDIMEMKGDL